MICVKSAYQSLRGIWSKILRLKVYVFKRKKVEGSTSKADLFMLNVIESCALKSSKIINPMQDIYLYQLTLLEF